MLRTHISLQVGKIIWHKAGYGQYGDGRNVGRKVTASPKKLFYTFQFGAQWGLLPLSIPLPQWWEAAERKAGSAVSLHQALYITRVCYLQTFSLVFYVKWLMWGLQLEGSGTVGHRESLWSRGSSCTPTFPRGARLWLFGGGRLLHFASGMGRVLSPPLGPPNSGCTF